MSFFGVCIPRFCYLLQDSAAAGINSLNQPQQPNLAQENQNGNIGQRFHGSQLFQDPAAAAGINLVDQPQQPNLAQENQNDSMKIDSDSDFEMPDRLEVSQQINVFSWSYKPQFCYLLQDPVAAGINSINQPQQPNLAQENQNGNIGQRSHGLPSYQFEDYSTDEEGHLGVKREEPDIEQVSILCFVVHAINEFFDMLFCKLDSFWR